MEAEPLEAGAADRDVLAAAMADAFQDDPVTRWSAVRNDLRPAMLRRFFGAVLDAKLPEGFVHTDAERLGAAIWAPPGAWRYTPAQELKIVGSYRDPRLWRRGPLVGYGLYGIEKRHPKEPHFYLAVLGVVPGAQGRGIGSRLMQPVLRLCDTEGVPAYLESTKESNIDFYARHGFRLTGELRLPRGPRVFPMWRDPR